MLKNKLLWNGLLLAIAFSIGRISRDNPFLFGIKAPAYAGDFTLFTEHPVLDAHLEQFRDDVGEDYDAYRNHCLRVLSFAVHQLGSTKTDKDVDLMALSLAYHDVALWSDSVLNYLEPSVAQMDRKLNKDADDFPWSNADLATARAIILEHHKYTAYHSSSEVQEDIVNAVRMADWADATMGIVRFGLPAKLIEVAYESLPDNGFHWLLVGFGKRLSPNSLIGQLGLLKIFKW
jgi:hypothetical protein